MYTSVISSNSGTSSHVNACLEIEKQLELLNSVSRSLCGMQVQCTVRAISLSKFNRSGPLNLHPLLIAKVRDECTGIPTLDAGPLPERPDRLDGSFYGDWTLEVRRIGLSLAHELHQPLHLFCIHCGYTLVKSPHVAVSRTGVCTVAKVAHFHHSRAQAEDEHTVFLVLCAELGHNDVQGRLGGSV